MPGKYCYAHLVSFKVSKCEFILQMVGTLQQNKTFNDINANRTLAFTYRNNNFGHVFILIRYNSILITNADRTRNEIEKQLAKSAPTMQTILDDDNMQLIEIHTGT